MFCKVFMILVLLVLILLPKERAAALEKKQRIGIGVHSHTPMDKISWYDYETLGAGWFMTWSDGRANSGVPEVETPDGMEFLPMVYSGVCTETLFNYVESNGNKYPKGTSFLIGNEFEAEIKDYVKYAADFKNCFEKLKAIDPTFKIILAALTSTGRLAVLDDFRYYYKKAYGEYPKPDGYRVNVYRQPLEGAVKGMRNYMKKIGDQTADLIITETCHPEESGEANASYLNNAFDYITTARDVDLGKPEDDYMMVQRVGWFVMNYGIYAGCSLYNPALHSVVYPPVKTAKTSAGKAFAEWTRLNLVPSVTPILTKIPECDKKNMGDADCGGVVNIADFGIWKTEFINETGGRADFNGDGKVSILDFGVWKVGFLNVL